MNISEEMVSMSDNLTSSIYDRIDLLKDLLSEYGEDNYLVNVILDLMSPGHIKYDINDERFIYDFNSVSGFCSYLMERQKARNKVNAAVDTLGPSDIIYTDTDSFKYIKD